jgi:hypothetical protein
MRLSTNSMICSQAPVRYKGGDAQGGWMNLLRSDSSRSEQTNMATSVTASQSWGGDCHFPDDAGGSQ